MTEQTQKMVESHDLVGVRGLSAHVGSIETQLGRGRGVSARSKRRRGRRGGSLVHGVGWTTPGSVG
jgi:hypothetical protein